MKQTWMFTARNGGLKFADITRANLVQHLRDHEGRRYEVRMVDKDESRNMRGWYHGALVPLVAFYQDGMDHRSWADCETVHGWLKQHFNSDLVNIGGRVEKVAKSTKGKLGKGYVDRVTAWLEENYAPPGEALDTEKYKYWRDEIFPYGGPDNYLDYIVSVGVLQK